MGVWDSIFGVPDFRRPCIWEVYPRTTQRGMILAAVPVFAMCESLVMQAFAAKLRV